MPPLSGFLYPPDTGCNPASGFSLFNLTHVLIMCVSVSPTVLVVVVLPYTLFLLASVLYGYLLGFGDTSIANPYAHTLTHPFTSHLEYVWLLVVLGPEFLDYFHWREEVRPFILVMGSTMVLPPVVSSLVSWAWSPEISELAL